MPGMSPSMKLKKGRPLEGHPNQDPTINIDTFTAQPIQNAEDTVGFTGSASDAEQGDLSASIQWFIQTVAGVAATSGVQNVDVGSPEGNAATGLDADTAGLQVVDLGGPPAGGASTNLDPDTAGEQTLDVGGGVGGGTATGLTDDTAGLQTVNVGGSRVGGSGTGLADDATVYTLTVAVDGQEVAQNIAITGSLAQDYTTLIDELNTDTTGATWSLIGGNLVCTSDTIGTGSAILIVNTDLFAALADFVALVGAVAGTTTVFTATINVDGGGNDPISINGGAAQTYGDLITELDADTSGASWSLASGDLVVTSDTTGAASTISVLDGTLFAAMVLFSQINAAVAGTTTVYTATVDVDGAEAAQNISIVGNDAQTFDDLITELDADTTGASWLIGGVGLICTSDTTGVASAVLLNDTNLFSTLTGFSSIVGAVQGTTTLYTATIIIDGNAPTAISIAGEDAQIFSDLLIELNAIVGPAGADFEGNFGAGDPATSLLAVSDTVGASSTILVVDTTLFAALNGFTGIDAAIDGVDEVVVETALGGTGAAPALTFTTQGVQDLVASITDGYGVTVTDDVSVDVQDPEA